MRIKEIRERMEKASEGPWFAEEDELGCKSIDMNIAAISQEWWDEGRRQQIAYTVGIAEEGEDLANATFIAHAREDIPYLLSLVDELVEGFKLIQKLDPERFQPCINVANFHLATVKGGKDG